MQAYRVETTLQEDGTVTLHQLPFQASEPIEIIVLSRAPQTTTSNRYPLRGTAVQYLDPTEPVAQDNWEQLERRARQGDHAKRESALAKVKDVEPKDRDKTK